MNREASKKKYTTIHYHNYLQLDKILGAQDLRSQMLDEKPAHEEMLFIIIHQVYELWFKQMIHELESVAIMFRTGWVDEKNLGTAVLRLQRIEEIMEVMIKQIFVLETMTPLDFLDFRNHLFPASGFQSFQFREFEALLGLKEKERLSYNGKPFTYVFSDEQAEKLRSIEREGSLFELLEDWLERTPFLNFKNFNFLDAYKKAVANMLKKEEDAIKKSEYLTEEEVQMRLQMLGGTDTYFQSVFDEQRHNEMRAKGEVRLSYKATLAALLITLYNDQPILHMPHMLLQNIIDLDELITTWRFRHAQMVMRMIGNKMGTGGSSGHKYLAKTAEQHKIFKDFHNISSLIIPRSELPELPDEVVKELGFYYTGK